MYDVKKLKELLVYINEIKKYIKVNEKDDLFKNLDLLEKEIKETILKYDYDFEL